MAQKHVRSGEWVSIHIHYTGSLDILIKQVGRLIANLKPWGVDSFFFIRYFDDGPHVRLRMSCPDEHKASLKKDVITYIERFFLRDTKPANVLVAPEPAGTFPQKDIRFVAYEPEYERYGGAQAITVSELQFQYSSEAVLNILDMSNFNEATRISYAIQMHLLFCYACRMDLGTVAEFFSFIAARRTSLMITRTKSKLPRQTIAEMYNHSFERIKAPLLQSFSPLFTSFSQSVTFKEKWMHDWVVRTGHIQQALHDRQAGNMIVLPKIQWRQTCSEEITALWPLYESYTHMTNNRLGIRVSQEGYIAYIIKNLARAYM